MKKTWLIIPAVILLIPVCLAAYLFLSNRLAKIETEDLSALLAQRQERLLPEMEFTEDDQIAFGLDKSDLAGLIHDMTGAEKFSDLWDQSCRTEWKSTASPWT